MKHAKRIGSLICVIAICFTLICAPTAHAVGALGGQAAGAWIAAGLVALNIVAHTGAQAIGSYFGWQSAPSAQSVLDYAFPTATSVISDYMNAATIKVDQGVTTIDGVVYDELWIEPGTFTNGLKTNLFDFKTKWSILSGQTGTLAQGVGFAEGVPIYMVNGYRQSQTFTYPVGGTIELGNGTVVSGRGNGYTWTDFIHGSNRYVSGTMNNGITNFKTSFGVSQSGTVAWRFNSADLVPWNSKDTNVVFTPQNFDFTYVSGVVPGSSADIPEDYGLSVKIPHEQLQTFYNTYPQYNVDNSVINIQQDQIDIDALTQAIFDQITSMEQVKGEWKTEEEPVPPEPGPPEPVPPEPAEDVLGGINIIAGQQYESNQIQYQDYVIQQQQLQQQKQQLQQQQQQLQQQQQINQNTESIKNSIEQITETPTLEDLPDFKFDLRELFPFCIPFDIYRLLSSFDAEPVAPHVQLPIVIESINFSYNLDLDFSAWNPVAQAMRTAELIVYAIGLAWATGKVIKW